MRGWMDERNSHFSRLIQVALIQIDEGMFV